MRFFQLAIVTCVLASTSLAAPLKRGFFGDIKNAADSLKNSNVTLSGIASTVKQSVNNPQLTAGGCSDLIAADSGELLTRAIEQPG